MATATHEQFPDRTSAGRALGIALANRHFNAPIVIALPRGGVPVGAEVAAALKASLSVVVVRKIGVPWQPELGVGAIAEEGISYLDEEAIRRLDIGSDELRRVVAREHEELARRASTYRGGTPLPSLRDRSVILVDDGIATGCTIFAAIKFLRHRQVGRITVAVPLCALESMAALQRAADEVIALKTPQHLSSVGAWYLDFSPTSDSEVLAHLASASPLT